MTQHSAVYGSFRAKDNDLQCRSWVHRSIRYARARVQRFCKAAEVLAEDPSVLRAWQKGWDAVHYLRLRRWRDAGFKPEVVYDIGAHEGHWAEMCCDVLAPKQIVLFEPQTHLHERIRVRQSRSPRCDWKILPYALSDEDATEVMHVTQNVAAASLLRPAGNAALAECSIGVVGTAEVPVRSLDGVAASEQIDAANLIKIDVQGLEGKVMDGGAKTLSHASKLVVEVSLREIYTGQALFYEVLQKVAGLGFVIEDITETLRRWPSGELWQVDLWLSRDQRP